jgi:DNA repair photolyase
MMDRKSTQDRYVDQRLEVVARKGRGALSNREGRFEKDTHESYDDGWDIPEEGLSRLPTTLMEDSSRSIIARNDSPDIGFSQSINPYRGCEHGCIYCYARPSHAYLGLSPGLDFETRLLYKPEAAELLKKELGRPGYRCSPIALGTNTDCYQPAERKLRITRGILKVLAEHRHPCTIVTKSTLVERDLDLLAPMAQEGLAAVFISVTSLNPDVKRTLEPRAASPTARLVTMETLSSAGVPVGVMAAPVIPAVTDHEMEHILEQAQSRGARRAGYVLLRLPREVEGLFTEWLQNHAPGKTEHVLSLLRQSHGGKAYDARFGERMRGHGPYADMLAMRFRTACKRLRLNQKDFTLDTSLFTRPKSTGDQYSLF